MDTYRARGKIIEVWETQQKTEKFRKREFVLEVSTSSERGTFIEYLKLQMVQNNCDLLDGIHKGDLVSIQWNPMGRRWKDKDGKWVYFTNLEATDITVVSRADGTGSEDAIDDQLPLEATEDDPFALPDESIPDNNGPVDEGPDDLPF